MPPTLQASRLTTAASRALRAGEAPPMRRCSPPGPDHTLFDEAVASNVRSALVSVTKADGALPSADADALALDLCLGSTRTAASASCFEVSLASAPFCCASCFEASDGTTPFFEPFTTQGVTKPPFARIALQYPCLSFGNDSLGGWYCLRSASNFARRCLTASGRLVLRSTRSATSPPVETLKRQGEEHAVRPKCALLELFGENSPYQSANLMPPAPPTTSFKSPTRIAPVGSANSSSVYILWSYTTSVRGDSLATPNNQLERSIDSGGAGPASSARPLRPARELKVAYQSHMWAMPSSERPRMLLGSAPPITKLSVRVPPSQEEAFPPRKGWFDPAASTGAPLSETKTTRVLFQRCVSLRAVVTLKTVSSTRLTIELKVRSKPTTSLPL
mmetsp:Transcript_79292/g.220476  ORF Transcript_79292/g.220476 Transcript_79292/m.220476 type:complete len:390 (-) Transcript_79292:882-2051(-)